LAITQGKRKKLRMKNHEKTFFHSNSPLSSVLLVGAIRAEEAARIWKFGKKTGLK
jgi:hypothetical protein